MPDDRSSGFGGSGFVRFNSSDNASRVPDKKRSKDENPSQNPDEKENKSDESLRSSEYVDRSAQLRATLNSLAMLNVAGILKDKKNPGNSQALNSVEVKKD